MPKNEPITEMSLTCPKCGHVTVELRRRFTKEKLCTACFLARRNSTKAERSAKRRAHYLANLESYKEWRKRYYSDHRDKLKADSRRWAIENKDRAAERHREYYQRDLSKSKARRREWYRNNPLTVRAGRMRRRARLMAAEGSFTDADIARLLLVQMGRCASCGKGIKRRYSIDHVNPLARGGSNSADNIQLLCQPCNRKKWMKDPEDWAKEIGRLFV